MEVVRLATKLTRVVYNAFLKIIVQNVSLQNIQKRVDAWIVVLLMLTVLIVSMLINVLAVQLTHTSHNLDYVNFVPLSTMAA